VNAKRRTRGKRFFLLAALTLFATGRGIAQESSSKAGGIVMTPPGGPAASLRDALSAACTQNEKEFAHFLTARNAESFARLTPAARASLMKRFVLLEDPGKASVVTNPVGRPTVRCETPMVTIEMQIGGAELQDNMAFLPLELRDATDTTGANVRHITMGLVRENGEWKLLSLGLLLLDLPGLEVEWDMAEMEMNERAALNGLRKIGEAVEAYRRSYSRLPESLANLGPALHGATNGEAAGLLDSDLATGMKNGYAFRYVILGGSSSGAPAKYQLAATPLTYGRTGRRSFFRDASSMLHGADRQGGVGSEADPKVE
jgi:hypothetical protein